MERPDHILRALNSAGFEAYYVGGCVRDTLLSRPVHDWDICTSALPEQTASVFPHTVPTGIRHGTVTVVEDGAQYEVTTFRCDGEYRDSRHPEQVTFVRNLREDLSRRDFTVNAMAMDVRGKVTDLFGGREDLQTGILRCVGEPNLRFREDALRMLRALRFSAQLGFTVEEKTFAAISENAGLCASLSAERVRDETEKTLCSPSPQTVAQMCEMGLLRAVGLQGTPDLTALAALPAERSVRWAAFFRACPEASWQKLRLDRKTGELAQCAALIAEAADRMEWKRRISVHGREAALCAASLCGEEETVRGILSSGECLSLRELAVSGADYPQLSGREVGGILRLLLTHVLENPADNSREKLLRLSAKFLEKSKNNA